MFGLSGEHLLILAGILLIFGPRKLPELGSSIGKALRNFKEGLNAPASSGALEAQNVPKTETKPAAPAPAADKPTQPTV
jgi:sec-independent protein translocase protein TatA